MNAPLRQDERLGRLATELGADVLVLLRFDGVDHLNDLFEYRVEALAARNDLDFDALVGTHATVEIEGREGIPRIGMEVVVEFLEGDPDKPVVMGYVYNGRNQVPYELPDNRTRSTFKTDTHQGKGYNELRFEDEKDAEEIFIHAQRDMNGKIEQHRTERVNMNKVESVGDSKASEVRNVFDQVVGGDMRISVGPAHRGRFTPADATRETQGIGGVASMIGKAIGDGGAGNLEIAVERDLNSNVGRNGSETLGKLKSTTVGDSYYIDVAKNFVLEAGQQITLRCGQSMITLDKRGNIAINGKVATFTMDQLLRLMSDFVKINE